jgi:hypothetical protein
MMMIIIFVALFDESGSAQDGRQFEKFYDQHCSPNIIRVIESRRMRWAVNVARMGDSRGAYRILVGRPEGKRLLGRPGGRWEDNTEKDLQEAIFGGMDWIALAQHRDGWRAVVNVNAVMNLRVP